VILLDPFQIRIRDFDAAFVLLAFVSVLITRFARIRGEHDRLMADLSAARSIQHLLIPKEIPPAPGLKIEAAYHPAQEVGGDFFQVIPVTTDKTLIVLGDVSGKGLPAAMTVSLVVGVVRTLVEFTSSPGAILAGLNSRLVGRGTGFTTCLAIEIDRTGKLKFANAGQLAPYRNGVEIDSEAGLPLGILPDLDFPEMTLQLAVGDRLTLMTDGIPEATSDRELFGFARAEGLSQQSAQKIAEAARQFGQTDDITVVSIEFGGDAVASTSNNLASSELLQ
jgi:serine phosphatase RsbU (regulator of sigma subunit)